MESMRKLRRAAYLIELWRRIISELQNGTSIEENSAMQEMQTDPELGSMERLGASMKTLLWQRDAPLCGNRLEVMRDKRPFRTKEMGLYGVGPRLTQPGDVIVLFRGAWTPYMLRPRGDRGESYFEFLREAYCHGIMDGEAAAGQSQKNASHLKITRQLITVHNSNFALR